MSRCVACRSTIGDADRFCSRCGAMQPRDGSTSARPSQWALDLGPVRWFLAAPDGASVLAAVASGTRDRLHCVSQATGAVVWTQPLDGNESEGLHADRGGYLVLCRGQLIRLAADTGREAWSCALPGSGVPVVRLLPGAPEAVLLYRQGPGVREARGYTLDLAAGRLREVVDHLVLEAIARRTLAAQWRGGEADTVARPGTDAWVTASDALFAVAAGSTQGGALDVALSFGLVLAVDRVTREPVLRTRQASGIPLARGQVHFADTDEAEVLVWSGTDGLVVLPLDPRLDPIRVKQPGLGRLLGVDGRRAFVEVSGTEPGERAVACLALPFGRVAWKSPADDPCAFLGLDPALDAVLVKRLSSEELVEFRTHDVGFSRAYLLPELMGTRRRKGEKADPGPLKLVSAGRHLVVAQSRAACSLLCAFERQE
jgi:hypothetical protein